VIGLYRATYWEELIKDLVRAALAADDLHWRRKTANVFSTKRGGSECMHALPNVLSLSLSRSCEKMVATSYHEKTQGACADASSFR